MKRKYGRSGACTLCKSPLRKEIELLHERGVPFNVLGKKYHMNFGIRPFSLTMKLSRHFNNNHPPSIDTTPLPVFTPEELEKRKDPATFSEYADKLLNMGYQSLDPKKITPNHVISAQRALLEERKIEGTLNNQQALLMKFFRGGSREVVEGEVINGLNEGTDVPNNTD